MSNHQPLGGWHDQEVTLPALRSKVAHESLPRRKFSCRELRYNKQYGASRFVRRFGVETSKRVVGESDNDQDSDNRTLRACAALDRDAAWRFVPCYAREIPRAQLDTARGARCWAADLRDPQQAGVALYCHGAFVGSLRATLDCCRGPWSRRIRGSHPNTLDATGA